MCTEGLLLTRYIVSFAGAFARSSAARAEGLSAAQALDAEALAACGLRVTQTERFYCEPKTEEA